MKIFLTGKNGQLGHKLEKDLKDLEKDKEFIKLSEEDKAKVKKDLITASELEAYKAKNEIVKKGLQDELGKKGNLILKFKINYPDRFLNNTEIKLLEDVLKNIEI